ncbi:MAG TPA: hypothetical protein VFF12_12255, partial [Myxococcaceae bacterium]|nr:hypothetical protein [Myxococcaceae bacterium]
SRRLGFTKQEEPDRVEADLQALVPQELWAKGHQLLIWHGRRTCFARSPACERCVVRELCPRIGVAKGKATVVKGARPPRRAAVVPPPPKRRGTRRKRRAAS